MMNSTEIFAQPDKTIIPGFVAKVIAVEPPMVPTQAQAQAGFHVQKVLVMDPTTHTSMDVYISRAELHVNTDLVGAIMRFESTGGTGLRFCRQVTSANKDAHAAAVKAGQDASIYEKAYIQIDRGVRMAHAPVEQPAAPDPVVTPDIVPDPEDVDLTEGGVEVEQTPEEVVPEAPAAAPEPVEAPAPVVVAPAAPEPVEQAPEPTLLQAGGYRISATLQKYARGQVLCRIAAIAAFEEAGFEVSAEHLSGAAGSLFIEMNKKGLMDEAVEVAFGGEAVGKRRKSALPDPGPTEPPRLLGDKPRRGPQQDKPAPVVTEALPPAQSVVTPGKPVATPTTAPGATAPTQAAPSPAVTEPPAPAAPKPGQATTAAEVIDKFKGYYLAGKLTPELKLGLHGQIAKFGMTWEPLYNIVIEHLSGKYGKVAVDAKLASMKTLLKNTTEPEFHKAIVAGSEMLESHVADFVKKAQA